MAVCPAIFVASPFKAKSVRTIHTRAFPFVFACFGAVGCAAMLSGCIEPWEGPPHFLHIEDIAFVPDADEGEPTSRIEEVCRIGFVAHVGLHCDRSAITVGNHRRGGVSIRVVTEDDLIAGRMSQPARCRTDAATSTGHDDHASRLQISHLVQTSLIHCSMIRPAIDIVGGIIGRSSLRYQLASMISDSSHTMSPPV